jgi:hypothetical protein
MILSRPWRPTCNARQRSRSSPRRTNLAHPGASRQTTIHDAAGNAQLDLGADRALAADVELTPTIAARSRMPGKALQILAFEPSGNDVSENLGWYTSKGGV